jgi:hypothetical protein
MQIPASSNQISIVIARLDRAIQHSAASRFLLSRQWILDAPPEPVIERAFRATRWRGMTLEGGDSVNPECAPSNVSNGPLSR